MSAAAASIVRTPPPPYYAVIFASQRAAGDRGYGAMAQRMVDLGSRYDGFLGIDSVRGADGRVIALFQGYSRTRGGPVVEMDE